MNFFREYNPDNTTAVTSSNSGPLSRQMAQCFNLDELRTLCLELGLDYEELAGDTKTPKIASFIEAMQRQNRLPELLALLTKERGHIDWQTPIVPTNRDLRNRENVLQNIYTTWIEGFLHHALSQSVVLDLELLYEPTAVARQPLHIPGQAAQPVTGTIHELFENVGRALLILGAPGSGKTITLLQLAESLLAEAQQDATQPLPVILNLSSWAEAKQPLADWLVEEVFVQYGVARQLSRQWITQNQWLYLLDGLDEVADEAQDACVAAINAFKADYPAEIVVCSRVSDYEALSQPLNLSTAVRIQPLSNAQIYAYLNQSSQHLSPVRQALSADSRLDDEIHSPLFLNIMTVALRGQKQQALAPAAPASTQQLFALYVTEMFARRPLTVDGRYSPAQALHWLSNLAQGMKKHDQSIFYLERLQPNWLPGLMSFVYLLLVGFICGLSVGVFNGLLEKLRISNSWGVLIPVVVYGLAGGISVALGVGLSAPIKFVWLRTLLSGIISWAAFALIVVVLVALVQPFGVATENSLEEWLIIGIYRGWNSLLFAMLIAYKPHIEVVERITLARPTAVVFGNALKRGLAGGALLGLISGFVFWLPVSLIYNLTVRQDVSTPFGLILSLFWTLCCGFISVFMGAILGMSLAALNAFLQRNLITKQLQPNQAITNSLKSALSLLGLLLLPILLIIGLGFAWLGQEGVYRALIIISWFLPIILLYFGGLAFIQHYCLRFLLSLNKVLPARTISYLDDMDDRILLRRVGGGWVFVHRALMDYFASPTHRQIE